MFDDFKVTTFLISENAEIEDAHKTLPIEEKTKAHDTNTLPCSYKSRSSEHANRVLHKHWKINSRRVLKLNSEKSLLALKLRPFYAKHQHISPRKSVQKYLNREANECSPIKMIQI